MRRHVEWVENDFHHCAGTSDNSSNNVTGFVFCALIWWNLNSLAKTIGGIWFALGLIYAAVKTRGFRAGPVMIDFTEA